MKLTNSDSSGSPDSLSDTMLHVAEILPSLPSDGDSPHFAGASSGFNIPLSLSTLSSRTPNSSSEQPATIPDTRSEPTECSQWCLLHKPCYHGDYLMSATNDDAADSVPACENGLDSRASTGVADEPSPPDTYDDEDVKDEQEGTSDDLAFGVDDIDISAHVDAVSSYDGRVDGNVDLSKKNYIVLGGNESEDIDKNQTDSRSDGDGSQDSDEVDDDDDDDFERPYYHQIDWQKSNHQQPANTPGAWSTRHKVAQDSSQYEEWDQETQCLNDHYVDRLKSDTGDAGDYHPFADNQNNNAIIDKDGIQRCASPADENHFPRRFGINNKDGLPSRLTSLNKDLRRPHDSISLDADRMRPHDHRKQNRVDYFGDEKAEEPRRLSMEHDVNSTHASFFQAEKGPEIKNKRDRFCVVSFLTTNSNHKENAALIFLRYVRRLNMHELKPLNFGRCQVKRYLDMKNLVLLLYLQNDHDIKSTYFEDITDSGDCKAFAEGYLSMLHDVILSYILMFAVSHLVIFQLTNDTVNHDFIQNLLTANQFRKTFIDCLWKSGGPEACKADPFCVPYAVCAIGLEQRPMSRPYVKMKSRQIQSTFMEICELCNLGSCRSSADNLFKFIDTDHVSCVNFQKHASHVIDMDEKFLTALRCNPEFIPRSTPGKMSGEHDEYVFDRFVANRIKETFVNLGEDPSIFPALDIVDSKLEYIHAQLNRRTMDSMVLNFDYSDDTDEQWPDCLICHLRDAWADKAGVEAEKISMESYKHGLPDVYPKNTHLEQLSKALNVLNELEMDSLFDVERRVIDRCYAMWHMRRGCEWMSLLGNNCVKRVHPCEYDVPVNQAEHKSSGSPVEPHESYVYVGTSDCGRMQFKRPDPFTLRAANFDFYTDLRHRLTNDDVKCNDDVKYIDPYRKDATTKYYEMHEGSPSPLLHDGMEQDQNDGVFADVVDVDLFGSYKTPEFAFPSDDSLQDCFPMELHMFETTGSQLEDGSILRKAWTSSQDNEMCMLADDYLDCGVDGDVIICLRILCSMVSRLNDLVTPSQLNKNNNAVTYYIEGECTDEEQRMFVFDDDDEKSTGACDAQLKLGCQLETVSLAFFAESRPTSTVRRAEKTFCSLLLDRDAVSEKRIGDDGRAIETVATIDEPAENENGQFMNNAQDAIAEAIAEETRETAIIGSQVMHIEDGANCSSGMLRMCQDEEDDKQHVPEKEWDDQVHSGSDDELCAIQSAMDMSLADGRDSACNNLRQIELAHHFDNTNVIDEKSVGGYDETAVADCASEDRNAELESAREDTTDIRLLVDNSDGCADQDGHDEDDCASFCDDSSYLVDGITDDVNDDDAECRSDAFLSDSYIQSRKLRHQVKGGMSHDLQPAGFMPAFPSWSICLIKGFASTYNPDIGIEQPGFLVGLNLLCPWKLEHEATLSPESLMDDYTAYVGYEYECMQGHRFFSTSELADHVHHKSEQARTPWMLEKDMPLYKLCPANDHSNSGGIVNDKNCGVGGNGDEKSTHDFSLNQTIRNQQSVVAQLMRIFVITPAARHASLLLSPAVKPGAIIEDSPTFFLDGERTLELSAGSLWILRLPFVYVSETQVFAKPTAQEITVCWANKENPPSGYRLLKEPITYRSAITHT